jgi:hypothetical protein
MWLVIQESRLFGYLSRKAGYVVSYRGKPVMWLKAGYVVSYPGKPVMLTDQRGITKNVLKSTFKPIQTKTMTFSILPFGIRVLGFSLFYGYISVILCVWRL